MFGCDLLFHPSPKVEGYSSTNRWQPRWRMKKPHEGIWGSAWVWAPLEHLESNLSQTVSPHDLLLIQIPSLHQLQRVPHRKAWNHLYFFPFWHTPYLIPQPILIALPSKYSQDLDPLLRVCHWRLVHALSDHCFSYCAYIWLSSLLTSGYCSNVTFSAKPSLTREIPCFLQHSLSCFLNFHPLMYYMISLFIVCFSTWI